jgi:small-conductance mechanosensitive channel
MTRYFRRLFSPGGPWGRILFALVLISLFFLDYRDAFDFLQRMFDTAEFTYAIGKYQLSVYDAIRNMIAVVAVFWATSIIIEWIRKRAGASIGISDQTNLEMARDLIVEGVKSNDKVLSDPEPRCFLSQFADSSVNFQAFFWIDHIHEYRLQVRSEVMFAIWHRFAEHGIKIPYPQRDLHLYQKDGFATKSPIKRPKQNA